MSSSTNPQEITRRGHERRRNNDEDTENKITEDAVERETWTKSLRYYYDRFRYYHFYIADKIETFLGVVSLSIIKLYFFLMGYGPAITETRNVLEDE